MDHECGPTCTIVNRDGTIVCKLTGRCQEQYIARSEFHVERTHMSIPFHNRHATKSAVLNKCSRNYACVEPIIRLLLYSPERASISFLGCVNTPINPAEHHKKWRRVTQLEENKTKITELCHKVTTILNQVSKNMILNANKKKAVVVASLYLMQHGKEYRTRDGTKFKIRQDTFLYNNLPPITDLPHFKIQKNCVRIGSNLIQKTTREI